MLRPPEVTGLLSILNGDIVLNVFDAFHALGDISGARLLVAGIDEAAA